MTDTAAEHRYDEDVSARRAERVRLVLLVGLFAVLGLRAGWAVLVVIAAVVLMVFFHELGHYLTAKWAGMKVTEFFIGFGPKLWSFRRGETEYGFKLIPAGAYVRIVGMSNLEEVDAEDEPRSYRQQSFPKRLLVVCAGSAMHMILAFVLLATAFNLDVPGGTAFNPDKLTHEWEIGTVTEPDDGGPTPAYDAGLQAGDKVVGFDGEAIETYPELVSAIRGRKPGDSATLTVERDGEVFDRSVVLGKHPDERVGKNVAYLGVVRGYRPVNRDPVPAIGHAGKELGLGLQEAVLAMGRFFSFDGLGSYAENVREGGTTTTTVAPSATPSAEPDQDDENRLLSIYGAVRLGAAITETGVVGFLLFLAQINLFIGLINMVPLLPFDGGHAAVAIYERIRSRGGRRYRVDMAKLLPLTYAVVLALVLLGVTSLYLDVVNPIGG